MKNFIAMAEKYQALITLSHNSHYDAPLKHFNKAGIYQHKGNYSLVDQLYYDIDKPTFEQMTDIFINHLPLYDGLSFVCYKGWFYIYGNELM